MAKTAQAVIETKVKDGASAGFRRIDKAMQNTAKQGKVLNQQFRFMRGGLGQVGHQIQDVAVQLQMGQNAMLVLGQQGSQVASLFGPGGAMLGAFLAVGAAISMTFLPQLFAASEGIKKLERSGDDLIDKFDSLTGAQREYALALANTRLEKFKNEEQALQDIIDKGAKKRQQGGGQFGRITEEADETAKRLQVVRAAIQGNQKDQADLQKKVDGVTDSFERQRDALNKQIETFGLEGHALRVAGIEADLAAGKIVEGEDKKLIARSEALAKLEEQAAREKQIAQEVADAQTKAMQQADKAMQDKQKSAQRFADGMATSFTNAIKTAENFKDVMKAVAASVIDSLIKMIIQKQIADAIFNLIPASLGGGGGGGTTATTATSGSLSGITGQSFGSTVSYQPPSFKANGGLVTKGRPYIVGERGHELFVPNESGNIVPNNKLVGEAVTINQTINISTGVQQTVRAEIQNLMPQITSATKSAVADARMRGGSFSKQFVGV
jgi:hypothetical protein